MGERESVGAFFLDKLNNKWVLCALPKVISGLKEGADF